MVYLTRNKTMTQATSPNNDALYQLITVLGVVIGLVSVMFKWINSYFAAKKLEKESFIKQVVETAMNSSLNDVTEKINTLFELREKDRENLDRKFEKVMMELKK